MLSEFCKSYQSAGLFSNCVGTALTIHSPLVFYYEVHDNTIQILLQSFPEFEEQYNHP